MDSTDQLPVSSSFSVLIVAMNFPQVLRFLAKLDSPLDTEGDRIFILTYHVVDATLELTEKVHFYQLQLYIT